MFGMDIVRSCIHPLNLSVLDFENRCTHNMDTEHNCTDFAEDDM